MKLTAKTLFLAAAFVMSAMALSACSAEVGSKEWCAEMKEKPKGDWTANEATEFAKNCVF